jgi:hypothetical protein
MLHRSYNALLVLMSVVVAITASLVAAVRDAAVDIWIRGTGKGVAVDKLQSMTLRRSPVERADLLSHA